MSPRTSRPTWPWVLAVSSASLALGALLLLAHDGTGGQELVTGRIGFSAVMAMSYPFLGAALMTRAPGNRLGMVLMLTGVSRAIAVAGVAWAGGLHPTGPERFGTGIAAWLNLGFTFVALTLAPLSLLWFPDGRLPDARRRWRVAQSSTPLALCALAVMMVLSWRYRGQTLLNDPPVPGTFQGHLVIGALVTCVIFSVAGIGAGVVSLFARWRRQHGIVRQQLKWYLAGAVAAIVLNAAGDIIPGLDFLNLLGTLSIEAAILIAVIKHNLWDIDRILNRTVVYGGLSATLATVYVGSILALGLLLNDVSNGRAFAVAASTLAAVTVAGPLRRELQQRVDRRFDRRKYDAVARIEQHVAQASVRQPVPGETETLLSIVLRDPTLRILYRCEDGRLVDGWGRLADQSTLVSSPDAKLGGLPSHVGMLVHGTIPPNETAVWEAVIRSARPCLAQCRLQAEVLVQVAALEQSRRRIVEAGDVERRRIERNLHDGAQQRLVSLALRLRGEQRLHAADLGPEARRIIDEAVEELRGSVEELRALAAGLLPGSLVSEGLGAALEEMASRCPQGVRVRNSLDHRHAPSVDEVAWFVAAEGVANAVKHSPGALVNIEVGCVDGSLTLVVRDRGGGGAIEGAGVTGLQDRVRAGLGTLTLDSPAGQGTCLSVILPCE